jgi:hypothetical protein
MTPTPAASTLSVDRQTVGGNGMPPRSPFAVGPLGWLFLVLLLAGLWLVRAHLAGFFLSEDFPLISAYSRTTISDFPSLLLRDWTQGVWGHDVQELRPVPGLAMWLDFQLWGVNAFGYHLTNLIIYGAATAFVYLITLATIGVVAGGGDTPAPTVAALASATFLLHPANVAAVSYVSGRTDLFASVFYLGAFYLVARFVDQGGTASCVGALCLFGGGLLSKESAVTLPATIAAYVWLGRARLCRARQAWLMVASSVALAAIWFGLRRTFFGVEIREFAPWRLVHRVPYYAEQTLWAPFVVVLLIVTALALFVLITRREAASRLVVFWAVAWPAVQLLPLAMVNYESPRHVLLSTAALAVTVGIVLARCAKRRLVGAICVAACIAIGGVYARDTRVRIVAFNTSGQYSRRLLTILQRSSFAPDDVLVVASHPGSDWFWEFSLPYAARPPFANVSAHVLEHPNYYCCGENSWVAESAAVLRAISEGHSGRIWRVDFDGSPGAFHVTAIQSPPVADLLPVDRGRISEWLTRVAAAPAAASASTR